MSKRVAIYCRVGTADQHTEPQLHPLRAHCEARGLMIAEEYVDHGVSGAKRAQTGARQAPGRCTQTAF